MKPVIIRLFENYGMPFSFLCDNGNPWGTAQSTGFSKFEVWLMELGILTIHGRIRHPQTQGKSESYNRSLNRECLKYHDFANKNDTQEKLDEDRQFYNYERPHRSLNLDTPAQHYTVSNREMPSIVNTWEYPEGSEIHKIKSTGYLSYKNQAYFLSEAFAGKTIAVCPSHLAKQVNLVFRQFLIARINTEHRAFSLKKAYLINGDPRMNMSSNKL